MAHDVVIQELDVDLLLLLQIEAIEALPFAAHERFDGKLARDAHDAKRLVRRRLLDIGRRADGRRRRESRRSRRRKRTARRPSSTSSTMWVRARSSPAGRSQTTRAANAVTVEAERTERVLEQQILLEAVAAAAALHELALERARGRAARVGPRAYRGSRTESPAGAAPAERAASRASGCASPSSRCVRDRSRDRAFASPQRTPALTILQCMPDSDFRYCPQCRSELAPVERGGQTRLACPQCSFVHWGNPVPVVAAVVERAGRVVLVHSLGRPPHWYGLVAGFLERGEHPEAAVLREVAEELGARRATRGPDRHLPVRPAEPGDLHLSRRQSRRRTDHARSRRARRLQGSAPREGSAVAPRHGPGLRDWLVARGYDPSASTSGRRSSCDASVRRGHQRLSCSVNVKSLNCDVPSVVFSTVLFGFSPQCQ